MDCSSQSVFIVIAFVLVIFLINSIVKQQTVSELLNKVSLGMLTSQMEQQNNDEKSELYRDLPDGTKLILENGNTIIVPPNSRLVETRNDIILQMSNGDLFIVPDGTTISVPQFQMEEDPNKVAQATIVQAEESVAPPAETEQKSGFIGMGYNDEKEGFNNELEEESKPDKLSSNYNEDLLKLGLEQSVRQQHKDYAKERNRVTNTASYTSVRDDSQDINPRVGLRKINYAAVHMDQRTARTLPTEINSDELQKPNNLLWQ